MTQDDRTAQFRAWIRERVDLAKRLAQGECGGSYGDAMLILSAILSGLATDMWPGKKRDRRRFVEIWSTCSDPSLNTNLISVPFLVEALEREGDYDLFEMVRATRPEAFPSSKSYTLVVTGQEVDQTEDELVALDPRLTIKRLRRFSYGTLFYKHVRSGYTHDYHTTDLASAFPMVSEPASVSYVNIFERSDNRRYRRIHFDVGWVAEIVESVASSVVASGPIRSLADPETWWIDG
jgi:hypothetical protein